MAKQTVSALERHLDKGILGVTGLVLLGAVAMFLVSSPNKVELSGGDVVTPGTIDEQVERQAERALSSIQSARPKEAAEDADAPPPDLAVFSDICQFAAIPPQLARSVGFLPVVPIFSNVTAVAVELVKPFPLPKPVLASGRSCLAFEEEVYWAQGMDDYQDFPEAIREMSEPVNWVTVSSLWNREAQVRENAKSYQKGRQLAVLGGIELQRRTRRADGSWSDEDWQTVEPYLRAKLPPIDEIPIAVDEKTGRAAATAESLQISSQTLSLLQDPIVQMNMLRPIVATPACGDPWSYPKIEGSDPVFQDDEYFYPEVDIGYVPSPATMTDRYQVTVKPKWISGVTPTEADDCGGDWKERFKLAEEAFMDALKRGDKTVESNANNYVVQCYNICMDPEVKAAALKIKEKMDKLSAPGPVPSGPKAPPGVPQNRAGDVAVGIAHKQEPIQQVWAIDGNRGSVVGGRTYQYRIRPLLYNPYFGNPQALKNPQDAKIPFVRGDWSEPSDPLYIEPDTQVFARSATKGKDEVYLEMFRWFEGVWVKHNPKFTVGDALVSDFRCDVADDKKELVTFNADAVLLDVEFDRPWCGRERGSSRTGVKFEPLPEGAAAIALVDASGNVVERIIDVDKVTPRKKQIEAKVFKPQPKQPEPTVTTAPTGRGRGAVQGLGYTGAPVAMPDEARMREGEGSERGGGRRPPPPRSKGP